MNKTAVMLFFSLMLFSCKKEDDEKYPANPHWLTDKISQMETPAYYAGAVIYDYEWNNEHYYLISIPLSSCIMCEFYNYKGVKHVWTSDKSEDFQKNAKMIKVVWQRDII